MPPPASGFAKGVLSVFDFLKREKTTTTVRDDEGSPVSTLRTAAAASTSSSTSSGSDRPGSAPVSTTTSPHGSVSGRTTPIPPRPGSAQGSGSGRTTGLPLRHPKPASATTTPSGSGPARTTTLPPRPPKKPATTTPAPSGSGPSRTAPKKPASNSNRKSQSDSKSTPSNAGGTTTTTQKLPHGNLFPTGEIKATGMEQKPKEPYRVGSMPWDYGIGSVIPGRAGAHEAARRLAARTSKDPEELKRMGNDCYRGGFFAEALVLYDKAIAITPGDATYHGNRAAALIGLKRLHEAVSECEEAIKLDAEYVRAHHRLGSVLLCLGQVENARKHLCISEKQQADPEDMRKLKSVEQHLSRCTAARRSDDWTATLREADAAIKSGADSSPQLIACRAEALLKLLRLDDAFSALDALEPSASSNPNLKIFGMVLEAYTLFVKAQVELAKGRYDSATICAEQAGRKDPSNAEIFDLLDKATSVRRAHASGNELFEKDRLTEACSAYAEGIKYDPSNYILYCNRAACWLKLGQYERAVHDCNQALRIQPNYLKALFRRASAYSKLGHWKEAVRDYEVLRRELPDDREIAESLYDAQVELMKLRGDKVSNLQFGGEVASVSGIEQFRAVISSPCASVVLFRRASDSLCRAISPFVDELCIRYPSMTFIKVDIDEIPNIAHAEQVCIVPTFKIYRKGNRAKEIICPSRKALETAVRQYSI